jgi:hypothetical protein
MCLSSLVVLLQVNSESVSVFPFEGDAPRTVDVQAVSCRFSLQGVEVEARDVQLLKILRGIENVQTPERPFVEILSDLSAGAGLEELLEALVPEGLDHSLKL